jgi:hypothetical protein
MRSSTLVMVRPPAAYRPPVHSEPSDARRPSARGAPGVLGVLALGVFVFLASGAGALVAPIAKDMLDVRSSRFSLPRPARAATIERRALVVASVSTTESIAERVKRPPLAPVARLARRPVVPARDAGTGAGADLLERDFRSGR